MELSGSSWRFQPNTFYICVYIGIPGLSFISLSLKLCHNCQVRKNKHLSINVSFKKEEEDENELRVQERKEFWGQPI